MRRPHVAQLINPFQGASTDTLSITSLPLMGIGNATEAYGLAHLVQASLPLMGIGNLTLSFAEVEPSPSSLPLMGIGNSSILTWRRLTATPHYPSWGSETQAGGVSHPRSHVGLITPHGDRKLRRGDPHRRPVQRLITPHGDRKPCAPSRRWTWTSTTHYPSWGSETRLSLSECCIPAPQTHYPSWGSETRVSRFRGQYVAAVSLPLMGIGNAASVAADVGRPVDSLPLMGIGNHAPEARTAEYLLANSLPLMGIGNEP